MLLKTDIRIQGLNSFLSMQIWQKRHYRDYCYWEVRKCIVPKQKEKIKKKVIITHYYRQKPFDKDNLMGGCKYVLDALTNYGLIYDDTPEWIDCEYVQVKDKKYHLDIEVL